jgi:monoamine oxidase
LAARLGKGAVRLNMPVGEIRQSNGTVFVRANEEEFRGDACICTAPTLVLYKIQFDPPLPTEQFAALKRLEYSRIVKSCVLFDERFWGAENFGLITDATCRLYFHSTQAQPGSQGILCGYATSLNADNFGAQDDAKRMELMTHDLLPVSRRAPETARAIVTHDWRRDPYVHGALAFYRPGAWLTLRPLLQQPHGKVLFAGEHLADWQGFMEGAVVTGQQAARDLIGA